MSEHGHGSSHHSHEHGGSTKEGLFREFVEKAIRELGAFREAVESSAALPTPKAGEQVLAMEGIRSQLSDLVERRSS